MHFKLTRRAPAVVVIACLALVIALQYPAFANVYATNLKSDVAVFAPGSGQTINFSFLLNENADTGVILKVYSASNNQLVREVNLGPLTKGVQTWAWDGKDGSGNVVSLGQAYYFTVTASDDGYTTWTQLSTDGGWTKYYHSRGLDVNKNPDSKYFGRIYVTECRGSGASTWSGAPRVTQDGLYLLNADCTDAGFGDASRTGGVAWNTSTTEYASPQRPFVGPDDLIYVYDWSDSHPGVWVGDPDFASAQSVLDPAGCNGVGLTTNHGSISALWTEGIGVDRILYTMDEDYPAAASAAIGSVWQYNIGNVSLPWQSKPDGKVYNDEWPNSKIFNYYNDLCRDAAGNWYVTQERGDGTDYPSVMKVGPDGSVLVNSIASFGMFDPLRQTRGIGVDAARNKIAFATYNNGRLIIMDTSMNPETMQVIAPIKVWAAGNGGVIVYSTDRGKTWTSATSPTTQNLNAVFMRSYSTGFAVGAAGTFIRTTNGGSTWVAGLTSPGTSDMNAVRAIYTTVSKIWTVGAGGAIYYSANAGDAWTAQISGTTADLYGVEIGYGYNDGTDPTKWIQKLFVCGANGTLLKTTDSGTNWTALSSGTSANLNSVSLVWKGWNNNCGWVVGDNGTILRTEDDGATWTQQTVPGLTSNLKSVTTITTLIGKIVAADGTVLKTTNGGANWTVISSGAGMLGSGRFVDPANGWAVGIGGTALATSDGGATWQVSSTGVNAMLNGVFAREIPETGKTSFSSWRDVAFDAVGNLYAVDPTLENLRVYSPPSGPNNSTTKSPVVVYASSGDTTPPSAPVVTDDGTITFDATQLHAAWSGAADPESGVVEYAYAIGSMPSDIGRGYVVGWTSAGSGTSATVTGLNLKNGKYYIYAKAKNGAGVWSDVGVSDGINVYTGMKIGAAKKKAVGTLVALSSVVVTGIMNDFNAIGDSIYQRLFFVEEQDRSAGMLVDFGGTIPAPGTVINIIGTVQKGTRGVIRPYPTDNVAYIAATDVLTAEVPPVTIQPMYLGNKSIGGATFGVQPGATGGSGLNPTGLFARTFGVVKGGSYGANGSQTMYIDDGSSVPTDMPGVTGVKCYVPMMIAGSIPAIGGYASVSGIVDVEYLDPTPGTAGDESMIRIMWVTAIN